MADHGPTSWAQCPLEVVRHILQYSDAGVVYRSFLSNKVWLNLLARTKDPSPSAAAFWKSVYVHSEYDLIDPLEVPTATSDYRSLAIRAQSIAHNIATGRCIARNVFECVHSPEIASPHGLIFPPSAGGPSSDYRIYTHLSGSSLLCQLEESWSSGSYGGVSVREMKLFQFNHLGLDRSPGALVYKNNYEEAVLDTESGVLANGKYLYRLSYQSVELFDLKTSLRTDGLTVSRVIPCSSISRRQISNDTRTPILNQNPEYVTLGLFTTTSSEIDIINPLTKITYCTVNWTAMSKYHLTDRIIFRDNLLAVPLAEESPNREVGLQGVVVYDVTPDIDTPSTKGKTIRPHLCYCTDFTLAVALYDKYLYGIKKGSTNLAIYDIEAAAIVSTFDLLSFGVYSQDSEISVSKNRLVVVKDNRVMIAKRPHPGQKSLPVLNKLFLEYKLPRPVVIDDRYILFCSSKRARLLDFGHSALASQDAVRIVYQPSISASNYEESTSTFSDFVETSSQLMYCSAAELVVSVHATLPNGIIIYSCVHQSNAGLYLKQNQRAYRLLQGISTVDDVAFKNDTPTGYRTRNRKTVHSKPTFQSPYKESSKWLYRVFIAVKKSQNKYTAVDLTEELEQQLSTASR